MSKLSDYLQQPTAADFYTPAMMKFDGSGSYYSKSGVTTAGNAFTLIRKFKVAAKTATQVLDRLNSSYNRVFVRLMASNDATAEQQSRIRIQCRNTSDALICDVTTSTIYADGEEHTLYFEYDATAGTVKLIIDGVEDINESAAAHVVTTGTLDSGSSTYSVGGTHVGTILTEGDLGFIGYHEASGLDW